MEFNDKRKNEVKKFRSLNAGEVFEYDNCFYMVTYGSDDFNVIRLDTGQQMCFIYEECKVVNAELVIT